MVRHISALESPPARPHQVLPRPALALLVLGERHLHVRCLHVGCLPVGLYLHKLHGDRAGLHGDAAEPLITAAAPAALQGDAGGPEDVLHLVGELGNDIH